MQTSVTSTNMAAVTSQLGAIFSVLATSSNVITANSTITAKAHIETSAGGPAELSPEGLAQYLLNALIADYNEPGTLGAALNDIGSSSNPWSAIVNN
jgi:hypothetical protein